MERFALKVDLSTFFNNVYQKVMILVDSQWGNVSKAEKRLKKMFKIDCEIGFRNEEGFYIPSEEPIEILKHVDFLIAFNKDMMSGEMVQNKSDQVQQEVPSFKAVEPIATSEFVRKKKRSRKMLNELSFATSTPIANLAKRLKGGNAAASDSAMNQSENQIVGNNENSKTDNNKIDSVRNVAVDGNELSMTTDKISSNHHKTQKDVAEHSNQLNSRSHIFYNESGDELISNGNKQSENHKKEVVFFCDLADSNQKKARCFRISARTSNTVLQKNEQLSENGKRFSSPSSISILENITLVHGKSVPINDVSIDSDKDQSRKLSELKRSTETENTNFSNIIEKNGVESSQLSQFTESLISCDESAVIELNESENANCSVKSSEESSSLSNHKPSIDSNKQAVEKILSRANDLTGLPSVGDVLAFKLKLINGKISDIFIGKCEYINKRTKTVKLHITDGLSQISLVSKNFICNLDDSNDIRNLNIKIVDMVDAKIVQL